MNSKLRKAPQILLGLIYFVFGLNGFLNFIPVPPMPENVQAFMGALMATGYFIPVLKGTEVACGLLLLLGVATPLVLVILAPITLQIFLFHTFMTPGAQNLVLPVIMIALHVLTASVFWKKYKPLFKNS